jgi:hypothetical protein
MKRQIGFTQSGVRAIAPCSKLFGTRLKRQSKLKVSDTARACALPHNMPVNQNDFVRHADCEAQSSRRHRKARRFPPSVFAQNRLVTGALCGPLGYGKIRLSR